MSKRREACWYVLPRQWVKSIVVHVLWILLHSQWRVASFRRVASAVLLWGAPSFFFVVVFLFASVASHNGLVNNLVGITALASLKGFDLVDGTHGHLGGARLVSEFERDRARLTWADRRHRPYWSNKVTFDGLRVRLNWRLWFRPVLACLQNL